MYTVELTNDPMPFRDDSAFDVKLEVLFRRNFETKKKANRFFKAFAAENNMLVFRNEASGDGKILSKNF